MRKSNIRKAWNLKITVIFLITPYLVYAHTEHIMLMANKLTGSKRITYIHYWSLQPHQVRIIDLVSHITYVCVCINFIDKWRDLQFKVDSKRQIFLRNFSWQFCFDSQSICQESAESKSQKIFFFLLFHFNAWPWIRTQALRLILHYNEVIIIN